MSNSSFTGKQDIELHLFQEKHRTGPRKDGNGTGNMLYILYTFYVTRESISNH